jgi:XTP/dITP diphosphohydrolase
VAIVADRILYFATGNAAKLGQLAWVAQFLELPVVVRSAREVYGDSARYDERGDSEEAIARTGALSVAARLGVPVVTEDTGLHVSALDGRPGIRAGRHLAAHGRLGLLNELDGCTDRRAEIISAAALAAPDGACTVYRSSVRGRITSAERWRPGMPDWIAPTSGNASGGGYNAVFIPAGETRTLAEIPPPEAMRWGYREPNFAALLAALG